MDQTLPVLKNVVQYPAFYQGQGESLQDSFFKQPVAHPIHLDLVKFLLHYYLPLNFGSVVFLFELFDCFVQLRDIENLREVVSA